MSYEPTTWKAGDTVTSAKLNKMEQGIANSGGSLIITASALSDNLTLDKTWQEIYDAAEAHQDIKLIFTETNNIIYAPLLSIFIENEIYYITFLKNSENSISTYLFAALSANNYPSLQIPIPTPIPIGDPK